MTTVRLNAPMPYPVNAIDDIRLVVQIIRNKELPDRKEEFAKSAWIVQGFIQGIILGEPTAQQLSVGKLNTLPRSVRSDSEALDLLETLGDNANKNPKQQRAIAVPPEVWQQLLTWLFTKLLEALTNKK